MKIDTYITNIYKWSYNFYSQVSFPQPEAIGQKKRKKYQAKLAKTRKQLWYLSLRKLWMLLSKVPGAGTGH